jgi:guanylate kinase
MKSFALAISAPSGVGKTTIARALVAQSQDLVFSVSVTTRPPRPDEQPGVDYNFVGRDEFESMAERRELLEWAEVHGELYGTPRANQETAEREGKVLVLDIDVQGAAQVLEDRPDTVAIFLLPPSFDALMERVRARGSEGAERLRRRLETARAELSQMGSFQYVVVNDRLDDAVARVRAIIAAERQRLVRCRKQVDELQRSLLAELERGLAE